MKRRMKKFRTTFNISGSSSRSSGSGGNINDETDSSPSNSPSSSGSPSGSPSGLDSSPPSRVEFSSHRLKVRASCPAPSNVNRNNNKSRYSMQPQMESFPEIPAIGQLEVMFNLLLSELGIQGEKRETMLKFPPENKWTLICQHQQKIEKSPEPNQFLTSLNTFLNMSSMNLNYEEFLDELELLRILLATENIKWVSEFLSGKGLHSLVDIGMKHFCLVKESSVDVDVITADIRCIKAIMNTPDSTGMEHVIEIPNAIEVIIQSLDVVKIRFVIMALEMCAALCLVNLDALDIVVSLMSSERILRLKQYIQEGENGIELMVAVMNLVNAIFSTHDKKMKSFCLELENLGLLSIMNSFKKSCLDGLSGSEISLQMQLDVLEETLEEFGLDHVDSQKMISHSSQSIFNELMSGLRGTPVHKMNMLPSILQHLLLLRNEHIDDAFLWDLCDKFIQIAATQPPNAEKALTCNSICQSLIRAVETGKGFLDYNIEGPSKHAVPKKSLPSVPSDGESDGSPPPPPLPGFVCAPTPPASMGGPPPPPPPQLPGGSGHPSLPPPMGGMGGPPPPPPPGGFGQGLPGAKKKPVVKPSKKLRAFNWTKIPVNKITTTIWNDFPLEDVKINSKEIEKLFGTEPVKKEKEVKKETKSAVKLIQILDSKRSQNINIMLSGLKTMSFDMIRDSIMRLDDKISLQHLASIKQCVPTVDEIDLLKQYRETPTLLEKAEQFMITLMSINRLDSRLISIIFRRSFPNRIESLKSELETCSKAVSQLKSSKTLKTVLRYLLSIGNYLNGGTFRGGAFGFKLESLLKIADIRSTTDGGTKNNLMHYLIENISEITKLPVELSRVAEAVKCNLKLMDDDLKWLKSGLDQVEREISQVPEDDTYFRKVISSFTEGASSSVEKIDISMKTYKKDFEDLANLYSEDPHSDSQDFFVLIHEFISLIERSSLETRKRVEREQKQAAAERRKNELSKRKGRNAESKGMVDQLVDSMRTGEGYRRGSVNYGLLGKEAQLFVTKLKKTRASLPYPKEK